MFWAERHMAFAKTRGGEELAPEEERVEWGDQEFRAEPHHWAMGILGDLHLHLRRMRSISGLPSRRTQGSGLLFEVTIFDTTWRRDWKEASVGVESLVNGCVQ